MINIRRLILAGLTLVFGAFNVSLAMFRLDRYNNTWLTVSIGFGYFLALLLCTVAFKNLRIPIWAASLVSACAVAIPVVSHLTLRHQNLETYDTWYVTAIGLLLGAVAVRGHIAFAITAGMFFCTEVLYFGGLDYLPKSGLSGAVILIVACIAISRGLESSSKEILDAQTKTANELKSLAEQQTLAQAYQIATKVALKLTLPSLKKISSGKAFSKADRETYSETEISLRDDIAGGRLINKKIKRAIAAARARGVDVAILDDGGIETIEQEQIDELLDLVASTLNGINTGRVTIRTQPEEKWLIRVTASRPRVVTPDLDLKLGER
ncbi:MAG: hypothetical protein RLZZ471_839 [Actinomycetota bacterium]